MKRPIVIALLLALLAAPVEARKRKRVKRIVYKKPPTVIVLPDVILPITYAEYWAMEQRKREAAAMALWVRLAVRWW